MVKDENSTKKSVVGRLAPSPTGYLHLGNAWSFLCAWLGARKSGGALILRIEDIDPQRSRPELVDALCEDLRWLGLDWDYGPGASSAGVAGSLPSDRPCGTEDALKHAAASPEPGIPIKRGSGVADPCLSEADRPLAPAGPFFQSLRYAHYEKALEYLQERGLVYPCFCTRKELRSMAGAPQAGDALEPVYPGTCRNLSEAEGEARRAAGRKASLRLRFEEHLSQRYLEIHDLVYGRVRFTAEQAGGDFALRRSDGVFAYQLAVVLDDIAMGVTEVVRGADIMSSTPRQLFLYDLFGAVPPVYAHVPLILDDQGERLAKRHASLSLRGLRASGVSPQSVIGFLAGWCGLLATATPCFAADLLPDFAFSRIRKSVELLPADLVEQLHAMSRH